MLHIFLTILKIPFILLAVLLLLLLVIMLLLLFVPVRYQASAEKGEKIAASGRITWLLHLLSVRADFCDKKFHLSVKLCGYPVIGEKKKKQKRAKTVTKKNAPAEKKKIADTPETVVPSKAATEPEDVAPSKAATEPETVAPFGAATEPENVAPSETATEPERNPLPGYSEKYDRTEEFREEEITDEKQRINPIEKLRQIFEKIKNIFCSFLEKIRNIKQNIQKLKSKLEYYKKLWYDTHTQAAYRHVKKEVRYLIKHYFPGKIEGNVLFGLDDPATTGQILGVLSVLQVFTGNHILVEADFTQPVLEGNIAFKGHIRACHMVKAVLGLLLDRHVRITVKRIRKRMSH